jgi:oleate hydratase
VPESEIHELATKSARTIPCMMPYITAFFMPRTAGDRPKVVPEGSENFAFLGQFADTPRDTVFTTEYSVRTAMEAVYTLLDIDRGVPEVFGSCYDIRVLLDSTVKMMDGHKPGDMPLPPQLNAIKQKALGMVSGTVIEDILKRYNII